eukprot:9492732-Pyramimonas_sp.AAC.1
MQPLAWMMHGGPGAGKSFVIDKIRKGLFEKELGWTRGVDFQAAALQAANASALDGNTIHSAFGLVANKTKEKKDAAGDATAETKKNTKKEQAAQRMSQWKWLIGRGEHGQRELHCRAGLALALVHVSRE